MVLVNLTVAKSRQAQKPLCRVLPGGQRRTLIVGGGSARPSPSRVVTHARAGSSLAKCAKKDRDTTRSEYDGTRGVSPRPFSRWLHPISKRRAKFSASHATLDPDRACSAAQDGTLSLSKAAIRLTQMMKAGDTFLYVPCNPANHNPRRPQCGITMTALQHWTELRRTLVFGAGVLP
jgi:hypothetical protein